MPRPRTKKPKDPNRLVDPSNGAAWRKHSVSTLMAVWHLYKGGMTEASQLSKAVGVELHWGTVLSIVKGADSLVHGPLILDHAVRCNGCGSPIMSVPCKSCQLYGKLGNGYREIKR